MSDLKQHLRRWGLQVEVVDGWQKRGRPYPFRPKAVIAHHTASNKSSGNFGSQGIVTHGRSDLPGPLAQFLLGRNGVVKIVAAGYANHAGYGGSKAGIPKNQGNTYSYGIEAENNGVGEKWSKAQLNAYYRLCAALLDYMGTKDVRKVFGHKEWAPRRKIDPAGINMSEFRDRVRQALRAGPSANPIHLSRLEPGNRNNDVLRLKRKLAKKGYFNGVDNNYFGGGLRQAYADWQKHLGYKGIEANGVPGRTSLEKLGYWVTK